MSKVFGYAKPKNHSMSPHHAKIARPPKPSGRTGAPEKKRPDSLKSTATQSRAIKPNQGGSRWIKVNQGEKNHQASSPANKRMLPAGRPIRLGNRFYLMDDISAKHIPEPVPIRRSHIVNTRGEGWLPHGSRPTSGFMGSSQSQSEWVRPLKS